MVSGRKTSQFSFSSSAIGANNTFHAVIIEGLEHEYPNGLNHPVRLADVLWQHFKNVTLPQ